MIVKDLFTYTGCKDKILIREILHTYHNMMNLVKKNLSSVLRGFD